MGQISFFLSLWCVGCEWCRVLRYWLEGEKKGKVEVFANLPGFPDNVRINEDGQFWVAIDCCRTRIQQVFSTRYTHTHTYLLASCIHTYVHTYINKYICMYRT